MNHTLRRDSLLYNNLLNLAIFPLWWYSIGFFGAIKFVFEFLSHRESSLGLLVWVTNLFTPMFGQTDIFSRLISLFIRSLQIAFRGSIMMVWVFLSLLFLAGWLVLPVVLIKGLIINFNV
ncbi:MAG: hypothetical protein WCG01_00740 [bacterium]